MVKIEDPSILKDAARDEFQDPLPQKVYDDGRTIYLSRNNFGPPRGITGIVRITDFDRAVRGDQPNSGCIQAEVYRAPEVILDAGYSYSADIWSLGVMLWDLLEGRKLFTGALSMDEDDEMKQLAYITALLGPPPKKLLDAGRRTARFYNVDGTSKSTKSTPARIEFEDILKNVEGEDKQMFIGFVRRMIKWQPGDRSTAKELLQDPWLYAECPQR
ncbi:hypothetical protein AWENTII_009100 [Aspergillus wentii]